MITPTPGRIVWYRPGQGDNMMSRRNKSEPLAAIVACVHSDRLVNLLVIDANAVTHARTSVKLLQDDDKAEEGNYAEWMPYQKGQAAREENKA